MSWQGYGPNYDRLNKVLPGLEGDGIDSACKKLADEIERLRTAVDSAKVALDVAFEDTGDQYYKNVKEKL